MNGKRRTSVAAPKATTTVEYEVPDGGYGWVVVICAFVFISLPMGISASFAIYFEEWLVQFEAGTVRTSLVGSVGSGCVPLLGSLGGMILTNMFNDIRLVGIIGCLTASIGFVCSFFVYDISLLAFTYGAIGGFGMGLMFNCAYLSVGYYFDKNRALATALASSGTGFGTLISRVIRFVIITYGWRGSLLILAGICVQCVLFGALIRPLYAKKVPKRPTMAAVEEILTQPDEDENDTLASQPPDIQQFLQKSSVKSQRRASKRNIFSSHDGIFRSRKLSVIDQTAFASHTHISHMEGGSHMTALHPHHGDVKLNPYQREDVFFQGSTYDLEQITARASVLPTRRMSIAKEANAVRSDFTSQITIDDVPEDTSVCAKIKESLKKSFDIKIFKSPTFCLIALGMTLHHSAFFIPYTYIISLTKDHQIPETQSEYLIICFGMSNFFNKLWIGPAMTALKVEQLYVVIITLLLGAFAASISTICTEFYQFVLACIMYGGFCPIVTIYLTSILVRYLGIGNLTNAFSMVTIIRGLGSLSGPPLAGYVIDRTQSTSSAFYVGTVLDVLAATMFAIVYLINKDSQPPSNAGTQSVGSSKHSLSSSGNSHHKRRDSYQDQDLIPAPKVIVTVPTAEGNLDKRIHYSSDCFDNLAARDQAYHTELIKERLRQHELSENGGGGQEHRPESKAHV